MRSVEDAVCSIGNEMNDVRREHDDLHDVIFGRDDDRDDLGLKGEMRDLRTNQERNYKIQKLILIAVIVAILLGGPNNIHTILELLRLTHP